MVLGALQPQGRRRAALLLEEAAGQRVEIRLLRRPGARDRPAARERHRVLQRSAACGRNGWQGGHKGH
eukprot:7523546-Lingulodinium_polyedra.AAC.1